MQTRWRRRWLVLAQVLMILPLTFHYVVALLLSGFVAGSWLEVAREEPFALWVLASLVLGGLGLAALSTAVLCEGRVRPRSERAMLGLGLIAGMLISLGWLLLPFTPASEQGFEPWYTLELALPLLVALRQVVLLRRPQPNWPPRAPRGPADDRAPLGSPADPARHGI